MAPLVLLLALAADPCAGASTDCRMTCQTRILEWEEYATGLRLDLDACHAVMATATATKAPGAIGARLVADQVKQAVDARPESFHFGDAAIGAVAGAVVAVAVVGVILATTSGSARPATP